MRKLKKLLLSLFVALMTVTSVPITVFAYNTTDYDQIEDDGTVLVDNKTGHPNATCSVTMYILRSDDLFDEGLFTYEFYLTEGEQYWVGADESPIAFQDRWENATDINTDIAGGHVLVYKFNIEPGTYRFPLSGMVTINPDAETYSTDTAYTATVGDTQSSLKLFVINDGYNLADQAGEEFLAYAKEITSNNEVNVTNTSTEINIDDYDDLESYLNAMRGAGFSDEDIERARAAFANYFVDETEEETEAISDEVETEEEVSEETGDDLFNNVIALAIPLVIIILLLIGIIKFFRNRL